MRRQFAICLLNLAPEEPLSFSPVVMQGKPLLVDPLLVGIDDFSLHCRSVGGGDCETNDGTNTVLFQPNFPAS
jgi:hypothetical protein